MLNDTNIICEAGLAMHRMENNTLTLILNKSFVVLLELRKMILYALVSILNTLMARKTVAVPDIFQLVLIIELL